MSSQYKSPVQPALSKKNLRAKMRKVRQQLCPYYRQEQSQLVVARLAELLDTLSPRRIGMYLATAYEVNLDVLIGLRHRRGEEIYLPHLEDQEKPFHRFDSWENLETGPLDLRHPSANAPSLNAAALDVIILPGLAFDRAGNRLGHGGGWYDRVLSMAVEKKPFIVGVCFEEQLEESVPCESFDVRMDIVVTPSGSWAGG
jgi:5-formyltetrahydrofolate cyclo-ligase